MFNVFKTIRPSGRKGGLFAVIVAAIGLGAPATLQFEGMKLKPYYDSVGVRTVCAGETEKVEEREYSKSECKDRFEVQYGYYSFATARFYNETAKEYLTPEIHAAFTDMSYNVGISTVEKSTMIRELNSGNPKAACDGILKYRFAGGLNCQIRSNNCFGVWSRRLKMHKLCLEGVK